MSQEQLSQTQEIIAEMLRDAGENGGSIELEITREPAGVSFTWGEEIRQYYPYPRTTTITIYDPGPQPTAEECIEDWLERVNQPWRAPEYWGAVHVCDSPEEKL